MSKGIQRQKILLDQTRARPLVTGMDSFAICLVLSLLIHSVIAIVGSAISRGAAIHKQDLIPVTLLELPRVENPTPPITNPPVKEKKSPEPRHIEKPRITSKVVKEAPAKTPDKQAPTPEPIAKQSPPPADAKTTTAPQPGPAAIAPVETRASGGAGQGSADHPSINGDTGVTLGTGPAAAGGRGTGTSGLGQGSGAPGLPRQAVLRTNREAKPIQTARATYPPMALRMGMEGDVRLRIEVDPQGIVTKAEIIKSGGAWFDEEALRAVKQSRFEPAQKDGQNVPAEFTYIYRFRLQR